jgi:predicted permease
VRPVGGRISSLWRALVRRNRFEQEMADEMRFHLEAYAADLVRSGVPADEACRRARMEFGTLDHAKDECRRTRGLAWLDALRRNVRLSARRLRRTPGFTAAAVATVALCLGANVALFALVDAILLRRLPFPEPDRLVRIFNSYPQAGVLDDGCSLPNYYERRGRIGALAALAAYRPDTAVVGDAGGAAREHVLRVSPEFFATLGQPLARGRGFTDEETTYETDRVVVLSDEYWRQRLAGDPGVLGRTVRVDGLDMTVVGVLPPAFRFLSSPARLFFPLSSSADERLPSRRHSGGGARQMIARLAPGATLDGAQAQVDAHNRAVDADNPEAAAMAAAGFRSRVVSLHDDHVASARPLLLLLQAGGLVLLAIGVVNVGGLLLVRASARAKELAVRQAIGAGRGHLLAEGFTETVLLALAGGTAGLAIGSAAVGVLRGLGAASLPLGGTVALDARVAGFVLLAALALGLAMGLPFVWVTLRGTGAEALHQQSRGGTVGPAAQRLRHAFVVAQLALAFVLLSGAGVLALSLARVRAIDPGFRPAQVVSGQVVMTWKSYPGAPARVGFADRLLEQLASQPGVEAAGVATHLPFDGWSGKSATRVLGHEPRPGEPPQGHYAYGVAGDYFEALGFALREGRFLDGDDPHRPQRVCVVDDAYARRYWPGRSALGQRLFWGSQAGDEADAFTVVGVVGAARQADLTERGGQGAVYFPYGHGPGNLDLFVVARTGVRPEAFAGTLRGMVRAVDPEVPLSDVRAIESRIADSLVARRSPAVLATWFAAAALALAAVGTYGVLAYAVALRRREIGLRIALGALPRQVSGPFVALALRLLAAGLALGTLATALAGRALQGLLFDVPAVHPGILAGVGVLLAATALLACVLPAQRAARVSPIAVLAEE